LAETDSASKIMDCGKYLEDVEEINRIIASIIVTTERKRDCTDSILVND